MNARACLFPALNLIPCQLVLWSHSNNDVWLTRGLRRKAKRTDNCSGAIRELFNALLKLEGLEMCYKNMFQCKRW